ncbi:hypothetical protein [Lentibacillus amyloliquefaciens]|uniref:Uncharacterized protein n=1 Tax=Lentibacillus amyloliquefaciens TaxID=1472767 RepID=A0A0U4F295_9BACI|nr:hypothetical protein [Lentibacillus amyloliquefaciens]ALX47702.1 hypothetical protein AOX59_03240 [Lentibacillus amyloliquefaciens]
MTKSYLPDYCFVNHPMTGEVVKVEKGKVGYYETDCNTSAKEMNASINVTSQQAEAMLTGCLCGWENPDLNIKL